MIRILILLDDPGMRTLMALILEREGYELINADDSQDAINLLQGGSYQLLIIDYLLPELNLQEFYNGMKADTILCKIGVIILLPRFMISEKGARRLGEFLDKVLDNGDGFITKPFAVQDLIELVKKVLGNYGSPLPILE